MAFGKMSAGCPLFRGPLYVKDGVLLPSVFIGRFPACSAHTVQCFLSLLCI